MTSSQQFLAEYGNPVLGNPGHYSALAYLQNGNQLYCCRVMSGALYGGLSISYSAGTNAPMPVGEATNNFVYTSGQDSLFQIYGANPGSWNNNLAIAIIKSTTIDPTLNANAFDIIVYQLINGTYTQVEEWTVSRQTQLNGNGQQQYLETVINGFSQYISVADSSVISTTMPNVNVSPGSVATVQINGQSVYLFALQNGNDGTNLITQYNSGSDAAIFINGWSLFTNPADVDVRILINAGFPQTDPVISTYIALSVAQARKDCIAILDMDPAQTASTSAMINWVTNTLNLNTTYAAIYAPMVKDYDSFNASLVYLPGSGYIASQFAYNDNVANVWYAPAGLNRGVLNVLGICNQDGIRTVFAQGDRDALYAVAINPLQVFPGSGNVIWGQKTLTPQPSALDRVNVRRLLIVIEKVMAVSLQSFVFEPNNQFTRFRITAMLETFLDTLSSAGAFQTELGDKGYLVVCNDTNNTPAIIDDNELVVNVFVKPSKAAEFIQLNVIVTSTGASFQELIAQGTLL